MDTLLFHRPEKSVRSRLEKWPLETPVGRRNKRQNVESVQENIWKHTKLRAGWERKDGFFRRGGRGETRVRIVSNTLLDLHQYPGQRNCTKWNRHWNRKRKNCDPIICRWHSPDNGHGGGAEKRHEDCYGLGEEVAMLLQPEKKQRDCVWAETNTGQRLDSGREKDWASKHVQVLRPGHERKSEMERPEGKIDGKNEENHDHRLGNGGASRTLVS